MSTHWGGLLLAAGTVVLIGYTVEKAGGLNGIANDIKGGLSGSAATATAGAAVPTPAPAGAFQGQQINQNTYQTIAAQAGVPVIQDGGAYTLATSYPLVSIPTSDYKPFAAVTNGVGNVIAVLQGPDGQLYQSNLL